MENMRIGDSRLQERFFDLAFARAEYQTSLFAKTPRRANILRSAKALSVDGTPIQLRVHRNHPFEFISSIIPSMTAFTGRSIEITIGDYDDSLSFRLEGHTEVELLWLDYERYKLNMYDLLGWLTSRVEELRSLSSAPILLCAWPGKTLEIKAFNNSLRDWVQKLPGVFVAPLDEVATELGDDYIDTRLASVGATQLSERANMTVARELAMRWLPALLGARLKAIVFDLDNTLWGGVLGEEGADAVVIDQGFDALHKKIVDLQKSGLFMGLLSRNEPEDVEVMFASGRMNLPDTVFSARSISWGNKGDGMATIAKTLRIGFDSILFVDDNPGELATVAAACPGIHLLHATPDPYDTCRALDYYPGLFTFRIDASDTLRSADLAFNEARMSLKKSAVSHGDYLASLDVELGFAVDPVSVRTRLHQLSQKTNQFNLTIQRFSETDVADYFASKDKYVVATWMSDKFSDSGLVASLFAHTDDTGTLIVDELCVSCRALGRGAEDAIIVNAIDAAVAAAEKNGSTDIKHVQFIFQQGPRNSPARSWLETFSETGVTADGNVKMEWKNAPKVQHARALPIQIKEVEIDESK